MKDNNAAPERITDKKSLRYLTLNGLIFVAVPILLGILMYIRIVGDIDRYSKRQVETQAAVLGELASRRLIVRMEELERVARYFEESRIPEQEMGKAANELLNMSSQTDIGIVRMNGQAISGRDLPPAEYPPVQSAFRGRRAVSYRGEEGLLFVAPVYDPDNGNIHYALYEFFDESVLFGAFGSVCFEGKGRICLADLAQDVTVTLRDDEKYPVKPYLEQQEVKNAYARLRRGVNTGSSPIAVTLCKAGGQENYLFVYALNLEGIYLFGVVPAAAANSGISALPTTILMFFLLLLAMQVVGTFRLMVMDTKVRETEKLREAKQAAEEAYQTKSSFLANMSHELRTPITTINGMNELILRETNDPMIREHAMDVQSAVQILLGLINDVLDFSKMESGMLELTPAEYSLPKLLRSLSLLATNRARSKSLYFEMNVQPDLPVMLYGDDIRIRQILTNLITNGVKYTDSGSVTFTLTGERTGDDEILLHAEVEDTGIGIKPEDIARLAQPYTRVDALHNRSTEGSGLGLAIVTNMLRLMNSELHIESVYGRGSVFSFYLKQKVVSDEPIGDIHHRLEEINKQYEYHVTCYAPKARVLMVDDNAMNRKIFINLLKPTQIQVYTVSSGQKCLDMTKKEKFDLIFMDHLMPEMDGFETLEHLRNEPNLCKDTPVIMLTANAFSGAQEHYLELGFNGFLSKPIVTEKLERTLCDMLPPDILEKAPQQEEGNAAEETVELPEIEGIDWDYAKTHINNSDILADAAREFGLDIDNHYGELARLAQHVDTEDGLTAYRIRVHTIKGNASTIGALSISELAKLLESAARENNLDKIAAGTPLLLDELLRMKENLAPMSAPTEEQKPMENPAQILRLMSALQEALGEMDISGADEAAGQLRGFTYPQALQTEMDTLLEQVQAMDFDSAAEQSDRVMTLLMGGTPEPEQETPEEPDPLPEAGQPEETEEPAGAPEAIGDTEKTEETEVPDK